MATKSTYQEMVDTLSKAASTLKVRGHVFEESGDTVTLLVGTCLLEIPRKFILNMTEVEGAEGAKIVDVSIDREAKIIQKTLVTPGSAIGAVTGDVFGDISGMVMQGDCKCLCECKCHCDCKCSDGGGSIRPIYRRLGSRALFMCTPDIS